MKTLTSLTLLLALVIPALAAGGTDFGIIDPATTNLAWDWTNVTKQQVRAWLFDCGPTSGTYTKHVDYLVPPQTIVRAVPLSQVITAPGRYFCRLSVQVSTGEESARSNEISFTVP